MTVVAVELGVSYKTVQKAVRELGLSVQKSRPRPVYSAELRAAAVKRYLAGESTGEIARSLGASDTWVQSQLSLAGVDCRTRGPLLCKDEEIESRYRSGESSSEIAAALGVSDVAVLLRLRSMGVALRPAGWAIRRGSIRHDAFADDSDPEAAYWAGFLMADGCVAATGRVTVSLKYDDHGHIQKWLDFLGSGQTPIRRNDTKARAQISSRQIADDLARHGVVPRKTYRGLPTSEMMASSPAFWRGMVDGDGTITWPRGKHGPALHLCGSDAVVSQFAAFLALHLQGKPPRVVNVSSTPVIRQVKVEGVRAREAIALLWEGVRLDDGDGGGPALERKKERARTAMHWRTRTEDAAEALSSS